MQIPFGIQIQERSLVAEDPGGGEHENSTKFCAFLRTVVANLWCLFVQSTLLKTLVEANAKILQSFVRFCDSCREFMVFGRLWHVAEDPGGGESENSTKICVFLLTVVAKLHGCLGHIAEDPGGGERENSTCAFLRTVVANLWFLFVQGTLFKTLLEANAKIRQNFLHFCVQLSRIYGISSSMVRC